MQKVKYISPVSAGKLTGNIGFVMGLLILPLGLWGAITRYAAGEHSEGLLLAIAFCVALPILYGAGGFIAGVIAAVIYNVLPSRLGTLEVELE